ncbi:unnamed protein product [Symbiodinium microadriaticum]|nr:unnamed protein product [Symbiodinium microadriaticum]CAE7911105.1 unnamed protein product [Symbiodinium sp. KB8]
MILIGFWQSSRVSASKRDSQDLPPVRTAPRCRPVETFCLSHFDYSGKAQSNTIKDLDSPHLSTPVAAPSGQCPETPFRWPSCGHALHLGCVARKIANVRDLRCPTCRAPWPPQAADVFTSACRAHGVPAPQPAADQDITTHQYHQALAPRAPSHVLPFCCPGLFLADSANAASDGAWQELPDRHMHWAPVHSRQTGCWSPEWVCTRCNSTVDEHHPLLQGVPAAPVCLTHGTRRFALDLREYSRGWVCFCGSPPGVLHCPGQRVPLPEAPTATEILAPVSWPNCRAGRRSLVPPRLQAGPARLLVNLWVFFLVGGLGRAHRLQGLSFLSPSWEMARSYYDTLGDAQGFDFECFELEQDSEESPSFTTPPVDAQRRWTRRGGARPGTGGWSSSDRSGESVHEEFFRERRPRRVFWDGWSEDGKWQGDAYSQKTHEESWGRTSGYEDAADENWSWKTGQSGRTGWSVGSWGRSNENWSWRTAAEDDSNWGDSNPVNFVEDELEPRDNLTGGFGDKGKVKVAGAAVEENEKAKTSGKVSSTYPPVFRAKPQESYVEWKRSVEFWIGSEAGHLPPEIIGPRIMVQLKDRAAQLVKHLSLEDVNHKDGKAKIFAVLEAAPLIKQVERHRIDEHRRRLMQLSRAAGESMESYVTRAGVYRSHLLGLDPSLAMGEAFYVGHILDHAHLTRRDKAMIKTKAGDPNSEALMTAAMMDLAAELEGESGYPVGIAEPSLARNGEEWLLQRSEGRQPRLPSGQPGGRAARGVFATEGPSVEEPAGGGHEDGEESLDEGELPPEIVHLENEAFGTQYKAKQKIAEVRKLRQYYKRPEQNEERRRLLQEKMKTNPCHSCGQLGHWSRECPNGGGRPQGVLAAKTRAPVAVPEALDDGAEWALLASVCRRPPGPSDGRDDSRALPQYMEHRVLTSVNMSLNEVCWSLRELAFKVILDIGCMRSVAGVHWASALIKRWQAEGRWFRVTPEVETFKFGDGEVLKSRYRLSFVGSFGAKPVVYGFSIVDGVCPPLFSRAGCTQVGAVIDCEHHTVGARKLGVKSYGLCLDSGHYTMPVDECEPLCADLPEDFMLPKGVDVTAISPTVLQLESPPNDSSHRSGEAHGILDRERRIAEISDESFDKVSMPVDQEEKDPMTRKKPAGRRKLLTPKPEGNAETTSNELAVPNADILPPAMETLTPDEIQLLNKRRARAATAKTKAQARRALTGEQADYPSLSHVWANEVALNVACSVHSRMRTYLWKKFLWQLRVKAAIEKETGKRWKKNQRWLGLLFSREIAYFFGHFGAMRQKLNSPEAGIVAGKEAIQLLSNVVTDSGQWILLEVFSGTARLTQCAKANGKWQALASVDRATDWDLTRREDARKLLALVEQERPDLVTLAPPCGPWSTSVADGQEREAIWEWRRQQLPLWQLVLASVLEVWKRQNDGGRLVLTEQPVGSEALKLSMMEARDSLYRVYLDLCAFGLCEPEHGQPLQKRVALDVNNPEFAKELTKGSWCGHKPGEHRLVRGTCLVDGASVRLSEWAARWPQEFCEHVLRGAAVALTAGGGNDGVDWSLAEPSGGDSLPRKHTGLRGCVFMARIRGRVKAFPLEKLRLATPDEMMGAEYITGALQDVEAELKNGTITVEGNAGENEAVAEGGQESMEVTEAPKKRKKPREPSSSDSSSSSSEPEADLHAEEKAKLLDDIPFCVRENLKQKAEASLAAEDPHAWDIAKKRKLFEKLAKQLEPPSTLEEAGIRDHLNDVYSKFKAVRKAIVTKPKGGGGRARSTVRGRNVDAMDVGTPKGAHVVQEVELPAEFFKPGEYEAMLNDTIGHWTLWSSPSVHAGESTLVEVAATMHEIDKEGVTEVGTGKARVEYKWSGLDTTWQQAYVEPLKKALKVYLDHGGIKGVPKGTMVEPSRVLSSRFVLTNKGGTLLQDAVLKARWIIGGHRDPDAGLYDTSSPTASTLGHGLLNFVAVQNKWVIHYEDVTAAFLQGKELPRQERIYARLPRGYPLEVVEFLVGELGGNVRDDIVEITKGGFGLPESPRLWYLAYKEVLQELGLHELRLAPGVFRAFNEAGRVRAMASIHVDDTRYAGDETSEVLWKQLHERLQFGQVRKATEGWQKFCGRWERQDPVTLELEVSMEGYIENIPLVKPRAVATSSTTSSSTCTTTTPGSNNENVQATSSTSSSSCTTTTPGSLSLDASGRNVDPLVHLHDVVQGDPKEPALTDQEKKVISSVVGQLNWAARQGRFDVCFGTSLVQQLAGQGRGEAMKWVNTVIRRAKDPVLLRMRHLGCSLEEVVILSVSDAAYGAMPNGGSQGGTLVLFANPDVLEGEAPVCVMEASSSKVQRVVRCSMSAEVSALATAFEHGDYVRALFVELIKPSFDLRRWKICVAAWKHVLVTDARTGYDSINSETLPTDRKIAIDVAVLRQGLVDDSAGCQVRWVPGSTMPCDGLTKWHDNGVLVKVMSEGNWSLKDTEEAQQLRRHAAAKRAAWRKAQKVVQLDTALKCAKGNVLPSNTSVHLVWAWPLVTMPDGYIPDTVQEALLHVYMGERAVSELLQQVAALNRRGAPVPGPPPPLHLQRPRAITNLGFHLTQLALHPRRSLQQPMADPRGPVPAPALLVLTPGCRPCPACVTTHRSSRQHLEHRATVQWYRHAATLPCFFGFSQGCSGAAVLSIPCASALLQGAFCASACDLPLTWWSSVCMIPPLQHTGAGPPLDPDLAAWELPVPVVLNPVALLANLRRARKGAAPGRSGLTAEILRVVLDDAEASQTFSDVACQLACARVFDDIVPAVALRKPNGAGDGCEQGDALVPALYALAQHDALAAAQGRLEPGEFLAAFLDDLYLVTTPARARPALDDVTRTVERHAGVAANFGKTRVYRANGGPPPPDVEALGPDVWHTEFMRRIFAARLEEERRLLQELPALLDMQGAWLLLLYCASPRAQHALRTVPPMDSA